MSIPNGIKVDLKKLGYPKLIGSRCMVDQKPIDGFKPAEYINIKTDTDWDFSTQYQEDKVAYLVASGYLQNDTEEYFDDLCSGTFYKQLDNGTIINIIMHSDEIKFRRVWDSLTPEFYYNYIWKRSPKYYAFDKREVKRRIKQIMNQLYRTVSI